MLCSYCGVLVNCKKTYLDSVAGQVGGWPDTSLAVEHQTPCTGHHSGLTELTVDVVAAGGRVGHDL